MKPPSAAGGGPTPPRLAMIGNGVSPYLAMCAEQLAAQGFTVRLVTLGQVGPTPGFHAKTRPVPRGLVAAVTAFNSFFRDLREFAPDALYVVYAGGRLGSLALISGCRPLVVNVIGGDVQEEQHFGRLGPLDRRTTRRLLTEADLILSKSDALRSDIARYGSFESKIETVRWGVDVAAFRRDPVAALDWKGVLGLGPGPVILSPRALGRLYQIDIIVEAMPLILRHAPGATLLVSEYQAETTYADQIRARVKALGLAERVRFLGPVSHADMPRLLSAADVAVSIPAYDGLPQTLLEALAAETPVVMGRLAVYDELVSHDREVLLADFTRESVAEAVTRLLVEPATRARLAATGLARVRKIADLSQEAARTAALIRGLISRPSRRAPVWPRLLDLLSLPLRLSLP
jgi:glycosyltransferase involved in cell wall biosynthesis